MQTMWWSADYHLLRGHHATPAGLLHVEVFPLDQSLQHPKQHQQGILASHGQGELVIVCCSSASMLMVLDMKASQLWKKMVPWMRMVLQMKMVLAPDDVLGKDWDEPIDGDVVLFFIHSRLSKWEGTKGSRGTEFVFATRGRDCFVIIVNIHQWVVDVVIDATCVCCGTTTRY